MVNPINSYFCPKKDRGRTEKNRELKGDKFATGTEVGQWYR